MSIIIAVLVAVLALLVWKIRKTFTFWNDKGVPYQTFWQYLRVVYDLYTKPLHEVVRKNYETYGRVYGSYQGIVPTLVVGDPDLLSDVLVKDFKAFSDRTEAQKVGNDVWKKLIMNLSGEEWRRARNILSPAFTSTKLKTTVFKLSQIAGRAVTRMKNAAMGEEPLAVNEVFENCAMDSTAALMYGIDLDSFGDLDHPLLLCWKKLFSSVVSWQLVMLFTMPRVYKLLLPGYPSKESTEALRKFVSLMIEEKQKKQSKDDDILQMLLDTDCEEGGRRDSGAKGDILGKGAMSLDEMTAQALLFFVAGTDTVMSSMTYATYFLALNPQCQQRVLAEIDAALLEKRGVTYESLQDMPYLEACIKETMRLYSPDSVTMRMCTNETTVAGVRFKPGMNIDVPIAGVHYDSEFFPDPEKFQPERFLPENKGNLKPLTFLAFGAGPRNCLGMRLGILQVKVALACILQHVRFETCKETMIPLKFKPRNLLPQMDGPLMLRVVLRHENE